MEKKQLREFSVHASEQILEAPRFPFSHLVSRPYSSDIIPRKDNFSPVIEGASRCSDSVLPGHRPYAARQTQASRPKGFEAKVAVKFEASNPGGSIKDRVALAMINEAERRGLLRPGGTIIEATAGNTGVGLAMVGAVKGYRCIFVLPDKMSSEKIALLKAYGANVVVHADERPTRFTGKLQRRRRPALPRDSRRSRRPNQFTNMANPEIHYRSTGPEIAGTNFWGKSVFVAAAGTGGTLSGVARYLKEMNPEIRIIGADPVGSVLSGGAPKAWKVEGIGEDFVPRTFDGKHIDEWVRISDAESFQTARMLARREGMLLGGSTGTNVAAALKYAQRLGPEHLIVTMGCDTGRNYLSKFFDDHWLFENKLNYNGAAKQVDWRSDAQTRGTGTGEDHSGRHRGASHSHPRIEGHFATSGYHSRRKAGGKCPGSHPVPCSAPRRIRDPGQVRK